MARAKRTLRDAADPISTRRFRPDDAAAASAVMQEAFRSFLQGKKIERVLANLSPESLGSACTYRRKNATTVSYVAEDRGEIVGYVSGSVNACGFGTLSVIGVRPSHFHRGVGTKLMKRMVTFWRKRKMRKASTCVSAHNGRALVFYLKNGFVPVGYQRDHFIEGVDEVILDRFLT